MSLCISTRVIYELPPFCFIIISHNRNFNSFTDQIIVSKESLEELKKRPQAIETKTQQRKSRIAELTRNIGQLQKLEQQKKRELDTILQLTKAAEIQKFGKPVDLEHIVKTSQNKSIEILKDDLYSAQSKYQKAVNDTEEVSKKLERRQLDIMNEQSEVLNEIARLKNSINEAKHVDSDQQALQSKKDKLLESLNIANLDLEKINRKIASQEKTLSRLNCEAKILCRKDTNLYEGSF